MLLTAVAVVIVMAIRGVPAFLAPNEARESGRTQASSGDSTADGGKDQSAAIESTKISPPLAAASAAGGPALTTGYRLLEMNWGQPEPVKFDFPDGFHLNSADAPFLTPDELTLYFSTSFINGGQHEDIAVSTRATTDSPWSRPVSVGSLVNTPATERGPALNADGLSILFTREHDGIDIWMARRDTIDAEWSAAEPLPPEINSPDIELEPFLSQDSRLLLFCRRGFGADGNSIWIMQSERPASGSSWTEAVALDAQINRNLWQGGAHLTADGLGLLFHSSEGGIFCTTQEGQGSPWSPSVLMIRQPAAQPWLSPDGNRLYYRVLNAEAQRTELWFVKRQLNSDAEDRNSP